MIRIIFAAVLLCLSAGLATADEVAIRDPENTLIMQLKTGRVVIEMRPDLAPHTVTRIKQLVRSGFYDGLVFHRVVPGVVVQGGDPTGTGRGGSGFKLVAEFSDAKHVRGTVSMARSADRNSADSQFFICLQSHQKWDGQYTIWGQVIDGMENVDMIKAGNDDSGKVTNPDSILWMKVAADVKQ
jgi:peptidylprolyl isomerase